MEKGCRWNFEPHAGLEIGPMDPLISMFTGSEEKIYYSLVREAIQNSMDAAIENKEVCVKFSHRTLSKTDFPELFNLGGRKLPCIEIFNDKNDNDNPDEYECLVVSDSNTKGMPYDPINSCSFNSFTRGQGIQQVNIGAGGAFGFGKGAYYAQSAMRSIIVSTRFEKDNISCVAFQGVSRLQTHHINNNKYSSLAFYSLGTEPITTENDIPNIFQRDVNGTDVWILALHDHNIDRSRKLKSMKLSVVENFWLAILNKKLRVWVDDWEICSDNISQELGELYTNEDRKKKNNPIPFVKAMTENENTKLDHIHISIGDTGKIFKSRLYIAKSQNEEILPCAVEYFRKPNMLIKTDTPLKGVNYCAVFVCDDDYSNSLLRLLENPEHNKWEATRLIYRTLEGFEYFNQKLASSLLREITGKVYDCLELAFPKNNTGERGIGENLLGKDFAREIPLLKKSRGYTGSKVIKGPARPDPGSTTIGHTGESPIGEDEHKNPEVGIGENEIMVKEDENGKETYLTKNLLFRPLAFTENDIMYHYLIIHSDGEYTNCKLLIEVGTADQGPKSTATSSAEIISTEIEGSNGYYTQLPSSGLQVNNVTLTTGRNKLRIRFQGNLIYSIKLQVQTRK
jgi:hypothetical protein